MTRETEQTPYSAECLERLDIAYEQIEELEARLAQAEAVVVAAQRFIAEGIESVVLDSDLVPQPELDALKAAVDALAGVVQE